MIRINLLLISFYFIQQLHSQVGVNNGNDVPNASAILEVKSTEKGFLPPRLTWTAIQSIPHPAIGLVVFDIGIKNYRIYNGSTWTVMGSKKYSLTDLPGNFNFFANGGSTGTSSGDIVVMGNNKMVYATGTFDNSLTIKNNILNSAGQRDLFISYYDSSGTLLWAKRIGGTGDEVMISSAVDSSGNLFISGFFNGTIDFDPGPGINNHTVSVNSPYWAKYDAGGNLVFAKHITGSTTALPTSICIDNLGNQLLCGLFNGTLDTDPSAAVHSLTATATDGFFAKYDVNGNWIWSKKIGGAGSDNFQNSIFLNNSFVLSGLFTGTVDFDPGVGTLSLTASGGPDMFFARYDTAGNVIWAKSIGGPGTEYYSPLLAKDTAGNICLAAYFLGTIDIDPNAGITNMASTGGTDFFIARYDASGSLQPGSFRIGGTLYDYVEELLVDNKGNIFITGSIDGTVDLDPSATTFNITGNAGDIFIAKYASSALIYAKSIGGTSFDSGYGLAIDGSGNLVFITGTLVAPCMDFNNKPVVNSGFFLARYEE